MFYIELIAVNFSYLFSSLLLPPSSTFGLVTSGLEGWGLGGGGGTGNGEGP